MLKLLYITNGINGSGGLERVLSVKASRLAEDYDYEVHILVLNDTHQDPFYAFSPKIQFHSVSVGGNPIQYFRSYKRGIQKVVNAIQPDVISVCDDGLKGFFVPKLIKTKAKFIYERHASIELTADTSFKGRLLRRIMRSQVQNFSAFIVLTKGNVSEWNKTNVRVIPNPLGFKNEKHNDLHDKTLIAVGSHSWNKGYDLLLEVWEQLHRQMPDWSLRIYGKIDAERTFIKMAEKKGLEKVFFHEPIKDIQEAYLNASVLVLPSRSEGFGMVLIEAMACGLPCVAFDCPSGPADIVTHGSNGFLIPNGDVKAMEKELLRLMKDYTLRKKMGMEARESVVKYEPEHIVQEWDMLFRSELII